MDLRIERLTADREDDFLALVAGDEHGFDTVGVPPRFVVYRKQLS